MTGISSGGGLRHATRAAPVDGEGQLPLALGLVHRRIGAGVDDHIGVFPRENVGRIALRREIENFAPERDNVQTPVRRGPARRGSPARPDP